MHKTSAEISGMGHSMKRKEDARFIQGKGNYVDDVNLPHMVYGQMVRSPYAHARIKSINTDAAKKASRRAGDHHRRGPGQSQSGMDADSFLRQADGAGHRQSVVSGAGSCICGGRRPLHRRRCGRTGGSGLRRAASAGGSAQGDGCRCAAVARRSRRRKTTNLPLGSRRQSGHRQSFQRSGGQSPRWMRFPSAAIRRRWRPAAAWPTTTRQRKSSRSG